MRQDYVRTARAKGLTENLVFLRHLMKNSLIPVITIMGLQIGSMIGGFVLTEEVFVLPGVGRLLLEGIQQRDFNIIQAIILMLSAVFLTVNSYLKMPLEMSYHYKFSTEKNKVLAFLLEDGLKKN